MTEIDLTLLEIETEGEEIIQEKEDTLDKEAMDLVIVEIVREGDRTLEGIEIMTEEEEIHLTKEMIGEGDLDQTLTDADDLYLIVNQIRQHNTTSTYPSTQISKQQ